MTRIAVVEDNPDNRLLMRALLSADYDLTEYETGQEALDGISATPPDLVLLDISLPEMSGVEVLSELRKDPLLKALPVVALTAHAMSGDREKFLDCGFDEYLSKPIVDETVLFEIIERMLKRS